MAKRKPADAHTLKSWKEIAAYLHKPMSTVQRWAREGMPVSREGRYVVASPDEISRWIGQGSDGPVHVAESGEDLMPELRRAVATARKHHRRVA